jgi:hypothetical protein
MTTIRRNLLNFSQKDNLLSIFGEYSNEFEYTANGIFRRTVPPACPKCKSHGNYNRYNTYYKKGYVKTGICSICEESYEEDNFWIKLKTKFFSTMEMLYQRFRDNHVPYEA